MLKCDQPWGRKVDDKPPKGFKYYWHQRGEKSCDNDDYDNDDDDDDDYNEDDFSDDDGDYNFNWIGPTRPIHS